MGDTVLKTRIVQKHDTEENWLKSVFIGGNTNSGFVANPFIPKLGEIIIYDPESDSDELPAGRAFAYTYSRIKVGDGKKNVHYLPFIDEHLVKNVQSDWNELDTSSDAYIKNKIPFAKGAGTNSICQISSSENENVARTTDAFSIGSGNISGGSGFKVSSLTHDEADNRSIFVLDSIEGLEVDDIASARMDCNYVDFGTIINIDATTNAVTVDTYPVKPAELEQVNNSIARDSAYFWVSRKQNIGTVFFDNCQYTEGCDNLAIGYSAHAEGYHNIAAGRWSHAEGRENYAGYGGHAEGYRTKVLGHFGHVEGNMNTVTGENGHGEGKMTSASGSNSHAEGFGTQANAVNAHAEGESTIATGQNGHAEGKSTTANNTNSHAEGESTFASGINAHAEGKMTKATDGNSHAEGFGTEATKQNSHAEGNESKANGTNSHAEGLKSITSGENAHAEGRETKAEANNSHTEGYNTQAVGNQGHAEGHTTIAKGDSSHAEGRGTIATGAFSHVQGKYNIEDTDGRYAHIVGNGWNGSPSNAHTIDWDGNAWFAGNVACAGLKIGNTTFSEAQLIKILNFVDSIEG